MHPMQPCEGVASGRKIAQRGKWRRRMNGSPTKRRKANSSHTQTIACIHQNATERNRSEIELPRHVKVRGTDDQNGRPRLPHEATFDCAERLQSIFTEIAAANCRQRYRRRHRHAADPDHHRQHMQCASQNDVIHNCTGKTVRPNSDIRVLTAFSCRRVCAGTNPPPIRTAALLFPHGCTRHAFFPSAAVDGIVCRSFPGRPGASSGDGAHTSFGQRDADIQSR